MKSLPAYLGTIALMSLMFFSGSCEAGATTPQLNFYERTLAQAIDHVVAAIDYEFDDVIVVSDRDSGKQFGPMPFGEALILNEKLQRGVGADRFVATLNMTVKVKGYYYGRVKARWNPSRTLSALIFGVALFRLDRAYVWPQFILDHFSNSLQPRMHREPFEIEWYELDQLLDAPEEEVELDFLSNIIREMRLINPEVDSFRAKGNVLYFGDRRLNRTQFVFEVITDFPGALACEQRVRTDYNPFVEEARVVKGVVSCRWSDGDNKIVERIQ